MNSKHRRTLEAIFAQPVTRNMEWGDIERLLIALGCTVVEGSGSKVRFCHGNLVASFHRPHPEKEAKLYQVKDAREFLRKMGVEP
jgi:hypothetical protein